MFHGWMFDPDGDQAAADSTRSSTSLDTGSSVNPRTARRLVTASYTSMIAHLLSRQHRIDALLLHQDHDELCRLRRARVASDRVDVVRPFVESLSRREGDLLAAPDPLDD